MDYERLKNLPPEVSALLRLGGWLVGSAVVKDNPKDYDILFEPEAWKVAQSMLHTLAALSTEPVTLTRFGGIRIKVNGHSLDVWCSTLADLILRCPISGSAHNPNYNKTVSWTVT